MYIKKGQHRIVVVIPLLKIALKFPRIYYRYAYNMCIHYIKHGKILERIKNEIYEYDIYVEGTVKRFLFIGIIENWREYRFYQKTKHPILQPTYFSFFGVLNIQKMGKYVQMDGYDLYVHLYEILGKVFILNHHHFSNPENFSYENEQLWIIDYGDIKVQKEIEKYGDKFIKEFDINYKKDD